MGKGEWMRAKEKERLLRKLDVELRHYRRAGMEEDPTNGLLRAVRMALQMPVKEIAEKMGVVRSAVFDLEARERSSTISLRMLSRMARAMECKVVYGIVPRDEKTLEDLAEVMSWRREVEKSRG